MVRSNCLYTLIALQEIYKDSNNLYIVVLNIFDLVTLHREVIDLKNDNTNVTLLLSEKIMHLSFFIIYTLGWTVSIRSINNSSFEIVKNEYRVNEFILSDDDLLFLNELLRDPRPKEVCTRMRTSLKTLYIKRNRLLQKLNIKNMNTFFILSPLIREVFYNR